MSSPASSVQSKDWRNNYTWVTHQTLWVTVAKPLVRWGCWPILRIKWEGLENFPAGACIFASNHVSNFDPTAILSTLPDRHGYFMAKAELYSNSFLRWFLPKAGAFPVNRGESDRWALAQAGRVLQAGQMLGMFPEGTRSKNGKLKRGKPGTVKLAVRFGVPIVPVAILNTQNVRRGFRCTRVTIRVEKPLDVVALAGPPPHTEKTFQQLTTTLMQRIAAMLPPEQRGIYG